MFRFQKLGMGQALLTVSAHFPGSPALVSRAAVRFTIQLPRDLFPQLLQILGQMSVWLHGKSTSFSCSSPKALRLEAWRSMQVPVCSLPVPVAPILSYLMPTWSQALYQTQKKQPNRDRFTSSHNCSRSNPYNKFLLYVTPHGSVSLTEPCDTQSQVFLIPGFSFSFYILFVAVKEV